MVLEYNTLDISVDVKQICGFSALKITISNTTGKYSVDMGLTTDTAVHTVL